MITKEEWLEAMKKMQEFCMEQSKCDGCEMEHICRNKWNELNPHEWRIPEK